MTPTNQILVHHRGSPAGGELQVMVGRDRYDRDNEFAELERADVIPTAMGWRGREIERLAPISRCCCRHYRNNPGSDGLLLIELSTLKSPPSFGLWIWEGEIELPDEFAWVESAIFTGTWRRLTAKEAILLSYGHMPWEST